MPPSAIIGTPENIMKFSPEKLFGYLHSHYVPSKMVVAAAGNLEHEALVKLVQTLFRHQANKKEKPTVNRMSKQKSKSLTYEKPITQAHVCLGTQGFSMKHKQRYPLLVMNTLLGEGMSSRLFQTLREKHGMAYTVYSFANFLSDAGNFGVYIGTDAEKVGKAIALIKNELEKLATKIVTSKELKRTKAQLKGSMMLSLENTSNRMMRLGSGELYVGEYIPLDEIVRRIDGVTQEQMLEVAQQLFRPEEFSTITLKPKKETA